MTDRVERVAKTMAEAVNDDSFNEPGIRQEYEDMARAAIADIEKDAAMDRLVAEGQRCDAMTPQEAAKVSAEARENIVDEIESIICETHEMDVRDIDYAENIVSWLERHHPAALSAISEGSHE